MSALSPETKLIKALRTVMSFLLAGVISVLSIAVCFNAQFLNRDKIEKYFNNYEYVCALRDNVLAYAQSVYDRNGLDASSLGDILSYNAVKEAADNYSGRYIGERVGYEEDAYLKSISKMMELIREDAASQTGEDGAARLETALNSIGSYFENEITLDGVEHLDTVLNVGVTASYAVIGVSLFFFLFIVLILLFLGERRHRSKRAVSISFLTAGLFQMCLAVIVFAISRLKRFDIYPVYLFEQMMRYVDNAAACAAFSGFCAVFISMVIACAVWIKKVKEKH